MTATSPASDPRTDDTATAQAAPSSGARLGPVTLVIPPSASMIRVGRLTASSIATIADMSVDDIDDVKIAVSEMITLLIHSGQRSEITLRFQIDGPSLTIDAAAPATSLDLGRNDITLARAVLEAVADRHDVAFVDDQILIRMTKTTSPPASP